MNLENLRSQYPSLLEYMETAGYSKNYTRDVRQAIERILSSKRNWKSYEEILESYRKAGTAEKSFASEKAKLNIIASFDCNGAFPGTRFRSGYFRNASSYDGLKPEYKSLIDSYRLYATENGKKLTTINTECYGACGFLLYLQKLGRELLADVTEEDILAFFTDERGYPTKGGSYAFSIASVFNNLANFNEECRRISLHIPKIRRHRKNIQFLTAKEREKIKNALKDDENGLSLRDRAIGHLFYYTGLRCSDISNIRLSDVDLENDRISICQQKTSVPLTLPLSAIVGNAIYDYVTESRIKSDNLYIFLSYSPPYGKLKPASIGSIAGKIYDSAEIRMELGDRRGGHLFRHNFATSMLESGVPKVVISKSMGQTAPVSVETYLSADMVHLKECSLSIEAFPVREGAFCCE